MAGTISFPGLGGDQDFGAIIDGLVDVRKSSHITPQENWKAEWESKIDVINVIDSTLSSFYTTIKGMDRVSELMARTASSSDSTKVTASAGSTAIPGSYSVQVGTNIKHMLGSDGKTDSDTTIYAANGTSMTITVNGSSDVINFGSDQTLDQMVTTINAGTTNTGVTASVVNDGSSTNNYRLVFTSGTGGSSGTVSVSANTTTVDFDMSVAGARIDTVENKTWTGSSAATSGGQYLGTTNKKFQFSVTSTGASQTVGTDTITLHWDDGEGKTGDLTFGDTYTAGTLVDVFQGVQVSLGAGTVVENDTFNIDIWHPNIQAGVDSGLAKAEKEIHSGFADENTTAVTATAQTFTYTYNGTTRTLNIGANTTLTGLKNLINNDSSNPGIKASVINDGSGLSTAFHLVLSGGKTGEAYKISSISHTLDNFSGSFTETQTAQNAMIKIDGYPSTSYQYMQKSSNSISDVIEGVTLTLVSASSATITVGTDSSAIVAKIQDFVTDFNQIRTAIKEVTKFDSKTGEKGILVGNYAMQIIKSRLDGIVTAKAPGFRSPDDLYSALSQLGISTDAVQGSETEGLLLLDTSILTEALNINADAVADVFSTYLDGVSNDSQASFNSALFTTTPGIYTVEIDLTGAGPNDKKGRFKLSDGSWGDWIDLQGTSGNYTLTGSTSPEKGMELNVSYTDGSGLHSDIEVRVKTGVFASLSDELVNLLGSTGPLNNLIENYNDIIDNINNKIEKEEASLASYKETLVQSFMRLDSYMTKVNGINSSMAGIVAKM